MMFFTLISLVYFFDSYKNLLPIKQYLEITCVCIHKYLRPVMQIKCFKNGLIIAIWYQTRGRHPTINALFYLPSILQICTAVRFKTKVDFQDMPISLIKIRRSLYNGKPYTNWRASLDYGTTLVTLPFLLLTVGRIECKWAEENTNIYSVSMVCCPIHHN